MARNKGHSMYFVCLLMPDDVGMMITALKHEIVELCGSTYALRLPPHITLIPPFEFPDDEIQTVTQTQDEALWGLNAFDLELKNFGTFGTRVIYVDVVKNEMLQAVYTQLVKAYKGLGKNIDASKSLTPHATIANRDLTAVRFEKAWPAFANRTFSATYTVAEVHLLKHIDGRWQLFHQSPLP
ncbi:MAG: 2'-5' RNA ligase family protein [Sphingobacteriales bacterium JAD_PAG50586_3]|nr:MAG: 2'-5' RNA ligase family protein [Sphingobacteriales bacterium JAD_PAG50586_3]